MKVTFKTIEFHEGYLDEEVLSIIGIDNNLLSERNDEYQYIKNPNREYLDAELRKSNLEDMFGDMNILIYLDGKEIGAMDCYDLKNKCLFLSRIEIIDKGKGYGSLVFDELKKYFNTIDIEQAIQSAIPFYEKNGFEVVTTYATNKFSTMIWKRR